MRSPRLPHSPALAIVLTLGAALALGTLAATSVSPTASTAVNTPPSKLPPPAEGWKEVDRLLAEQKVQAALELASQLRARAQQAGDQVEWARGLIRETQLQMALHGYETVVRFLREQPWPEEPLPHALLDLFYGHALVAYQQAYSWEIRQREEVVSTQVPDLEAWTREQIYGEAQRAFLAAWKQREAWGGASVELVSEFIAANDYPREVRGTLRDAVSYLFAELLADSSQWEPRQSNELYRLPLAALIEGAASPSGGPQPTAGGDLTPAEPTTPGGVAEVTAADALAHPLAKLAAVLGDLERWQRSSGRQEAAFEARRQRLEHLRGAFTGGEDRERLREALVAALAELGPQHPWWSLGTVTLAEWTREEDDPQALVKARALALEAETRHPASVGGQRGRHLAADLVAPGYMLQTMASDAPGRRSLLVDHRNLPRLHFRAYRLDLDAVLRSSRDYNLLPSWREVPELVRRQKPVAEWTLDLPATPDLRGHHTYVTPPLRETGLHVIVASMRPDFAPGARNRVAAVDVVITRLVMLAEMGDGGFDVRVVDGDTGLAAGGATVELWRLDWNNGHRRVRTVTAGTNGRAALRWTHEGTPHVLLARLGGDVVLDPSHLYPQERPAEPHRDRALLYTDRSVYRPGQELHWKAVAYAGRDGRFQTSPGSRLEVELVDANGEVVESRQVTANDFGSAAGSFTVPHGRLLGAWQLRTRGEGTGIRVEEYKRPTFEVTLRDPAEPLRLNRRAELVGEARYYFGLPVASGAVRWTVSRQPVYPYWWSWWWGGAPAAPQVIAAGTSPLREDGTFEVGFTPEADERDAATPGMSYRYQLAAEATDEGGETRTAERTFRLGFVTVEATLQPAADFFVQGEPGKVAVRRTDLDGTPRAGAGSWRLVRLREPERTLLPADQPRPADPRTGREQVYRTPGDLLRPRWQHDYAAASVLRTWEDGALAGEGKLEHGEQGNAEIALPAALAAGAYRLRYTTRDGFGAAFETHQELLVVAPGARPLPLPALFRVESRSVPVGGRARILVASGLAGQEMVVEVQRREGPVERHVVPAGEGTRLLTVPVGEGERGGFTLRFTAVRNHQLMQGQEQVYVPWDDRVLAVELATFRDRIRPGARETWRVVVRGADEATLAAGAAELLAYMYDRSLDLFAPHAPMSPLAVYPGAPWAPPLQSSLRHAGESWSEGQLAELPGYPSLSADRLVFLDAYGIGGPGLRRKLMSLGYVGGVAEAAGMPASAPAPAPQGDVELEMAPAGREARARADGSVLTDRINVGGNEADQQSLDSANGGPVAPVELRSQFAETAFWQPQLLTGDDGTVAFEFTAPDSVTEWNLWVHALTRDLRGGSLQRQVRTVKELMVRPYLPRFLREGDEAILQVTVQDAGEQPLAGTLRLEILDADSEESRLADFGLTPEGAQKRFAVEPGKGVTLSFPIVAPPRPGQVAFRVTARAGDWSDGELRPLPVLPGRMHLVQSRFATLHDRDRRVLHFADLAAAANDPTLLHDQLVVTVDGQLLNSVLAALPYLVDYPYECTEQTLNRFVSTGIVSAVFAEHPALARLGRELAAQRDTPLAPWALDDPNRRMALEESPWLVTARGGNAGGLPLLRVLDPKVARVQRDLALAKLEKAQTSLGAFPWWPGGPPSPYMTLYLLAGFSRAREHGVEVPRDMVVRAWSYMHRHYLDEVVREMIEGDCCWELVTFLNYVLSSYPESAGQGAGVESWTGGVFTAAERKRMLDFSYLHWKQHSPLLKAQLALTLQRAGRRADARLVWDSVMDSARTTPDEGTFWAPEDRAWLWYNDTIETHAFALRTLTELAPQDARRHGLVQWLLLNKKLNAWKSTRATAEALYALVYYLRAEGALGIEERARVTVGDRAATFRFPPDRLQPVVEGARGEEGRANQLVIPGAEVDPATMADVVVEKDTKGFLFASATWHFSTERLPEASRGDFFTVERSFFRRLQADGKWQLQPLAEGAALRPGDQLEVHLAIRARHAAEYVHLRDPRPAGAEPESLRSGWKWELLPYYEEVRDSGANFFFEWLPAGEYTFKHRLRVATAGTFRVAPATLQSMYAPEFAAYSAGARLRVLPAEPPAAAARR